jgi:hypothetical protein
VAKGKSPQSEEPSRKPISGSKDHRKTMRAASHVRSADRKAARRDAQAAREARNRARRAAGEPLPWQVAQAARRERRVAVQRKD